MESCKCPITQQLFEDPVIADDGHTYERKAITDWLQKNNTSPITRQTININTLRTNYIVKQMIEEIRNTFNSTKTQFQFQLDVDIRKTRQKAIFQGFGKTIYEVEWINRDGPPIILLKIGGAKANREASFYVQLSCHPNIVRTFGFVQSNSDSIMLLQEYATHGDLSDLLQENGFKPNENVLWNIFEQISDAMICLADNGIVHGDLACRNVLVFQYNTNDPHKNLVKLTDFGLTRGSQLYSVVDSPAMSTMKIVPTRYAAPETLRDPNKPIYSEKSDVYSMGVLMWEACSYGQLPYPSLTNDNHVRQRKLNDERLQQPSLCSDELWIIINDCWHLDPQHRIDFRSLKQSLLKLEYQTIYKPENQSQKQGNSKHLSTRLLSTTPKINDPSNFSKSPTTKIPTQTDNSQLPLFYSYNHPPLMHYNDINAIRICDCRRKCISQRELDEHKLNNCTNRVVQCSFCQESYDSSTALQDHLMQCGNKTNQCPNCHKFIRRAIFAYHCENNCANLEESDTPTPRSRSSSEHRPSSRSNKTVLKENNVNDNDQLNISNSQSNPLNRISSSKSNKRYLLDIIECEFCNSRCARSDYDSHKDICLQNPINLKKERQRTSSISNKNESRPSTIERGRSPDIVRIPCEFCNEQIDLRSWSTHVQDCREKESRRIKDRAEIINREPVTENFPCEHCEKLFTFERLQTHETVCPKNPEKPARAAQLAKTQTLAAAGLSNGSSKSERDPTLSYYSSLRPSSSSTSTSNRLSRSKDIVDRSKDQERNLTSQDQRLSSHLTVNTKQDPENLKFRDNDASTVAISIRQPVKQHRTSDDSGSPLINSSGDVSISSTLPLVLNNRSLSGTQSLPRRIVSASPGRPPIDRVSFDRQPEARRLMPPRSKSPTVHTSNAKKAPNDHLVKDNVIFNSPRSEDLDHEPILNDRNRRTTNSNKPKSKSSLLAQPMRFGRK